MAANLMLLRVSAPSLIWQLCKCGIKFRCQIFFILFLILFQRCKVLTAKQLLTGQDGPPENSPKTFLIYGWLTQQGLYNFTGKFFLFLWGEIISSSLYRQIHPFLLGFDYFYISQNVFDGVRSTRRKNQVETRKIHQ